MRGWTRALLGGLLLCAVAAAGIGLNFTLLRLTGDAHDPVGKLSPRAIFPGETSPTTETQTEPTRTETQPTETQPTETQLTETQPTETQPTETQPTETVPGSDDGPGKGDDDD